MFNSARGFAVGLTSLLRCAAACLFITLALASSAQAAGLTPSLSTSDPSPVVGNSVTYTDSGSGEYPYPACLAKHTFSVDGQVVSTVVAGGSSASFNYTFQTAGSHSVSATILIVKSSDHSQPCDSSSAQSSPATLAVSVRDFGGTITVSPDPALTNQQATLSVTPTGGFPSYTYAFDTQNSGVFTPDGPNRTISATFTTAGPHLVRVRITDSKTPTADTTIVSRTITVTDPPPNQPPPSTTPAPGPNPPPAPSNQPPPAPCTKTLAFQLSVFTTSGCFKQVSASPSAHWQTTDAVTLNGLALPDSGQTSTITFPTVGEPGGHFATSNAAVKVGSLLAFSGDIDWTLPAGGPGDDKVFRTLAVPNFARLFGLRIRGTIDMRLGLAKDGSPFVAFPLNIELPPAFKTGPDASFDGATGAASVRVDNSGVHFDGLKFKVANVYVGKLKVDEACFSYVPSGGQATSPCDAPSLDGKPYITCNTDSTADRWDGNAVIELPTASKTKLAAFGGLSNGQVSSLGGFVDGLGQSVPIAEGVFLDRVGVGLCLNPPPFKLRGDVGVTALPTPKGATVTIDGHFLYTDATATEPWSLELGGSIKVFDTNVGSGSVTFRPTGDVDFGLEAGINYGNVVSLTGSIAGWVQPRNNLFQVSGEIKGCLDKVCAKASAIVSSTGVAGCLDLGTISVPVPTNVREGPFGFGSISADVTYETISLSAGFGYQWGGSVDLLGGSCDFGPYSATKLSASVAAAGAGTIENIAIGTRAVALRVHGTHGPPKIVVRGPHGMRITSPTNGRAKVSKGHYLLLENGSDGTTSVLLIKPAAGTWTVSRTPGAGSRPTRVDRSSWQAPAAFGAIVRRRGAKRVLSMVYAAPKGVSIRLVEHGRQVNRTIVASVRGHGCPAASLPGVKRGRPFLCLSVSFTPARGPGGPRQIQAVITRGKMPLAITNVASFMAPRLTRPSRPARLGIRRYRGALVITFAPSRGASRYAVSAVLSDGRMLGFDLGPNCRAVRIPSTPNGVAGTVSVAGVRFDLVAGDKRAVSIKANASSAGSGGALPARVCR